MKTRVALFMVFLISLFLVGFNPTHALAEEGGSISNEAIIGFYAEKVVPSTKPKPKPSAILPQTGEKFQLMLITLGSTIIIGAIIIVICMRRKEAADDY